MRRAREGPDEDDAERQRQRRRVEEHVIEWAQGLVAFDYDLFREEVIHRLGAPDFARLQAVLLRSHLRRTFPNLSERMARVWEELLYRDNGPALPSNDHGPVRDRQGKVRQETAETSLAYPFARVFAARRDRGVSLAGAQRLYAAASFLKRIMALTVQIFRGNEWRSYYFPIRQATRPIFGPFLGAGAFPSIVPHAAIDALDQEAMHYDRRLVASVVSNALVSNAAVNSRMGLARVPMIAERRVTRLPDQRLTIDVIDVVAAATMRIEDWDIDDAEEDNELAVARGNVYLDTDQRMRDNLRKDWPLPVLPPPPWAPGAPQLKFEMLQPDDVDYAEASRRTRPPPGFEPNIGNTVDQRQSSGYALVAGPQRQRVAWFRSQLRIAVAHQGEVVDFDDLDHLVDTLENEDVTFVCDVTDILVAVEPLLFIKKIILPVAEAEIQLDPTESLLNGVMRYARQADSDLMRVTPAERWLAVIGNAAHTNAIRRLLDLAINPDHDYGATADWIENSEEAYDLLYSLSHESTYSRPKLVFFKNQRGCDLCGVQGYTTSVYAQGKDEKEPCYCCSLCAHA